MFHFPQIKQKMGGGGIGINNGEKHFDSFFLNPAIWCDFFKILSFLLVFKNQAISQKAPDKSFWFLLNFAIGTY